MRQFPYAAFAPVTIATLFTFATTTTATIAGDIAIDSKVVGCVAVLNAKTDGKTVVWILPEGLTQPVPPEVFKDSKVCVCVAAKAGSYKVYAISSVGDKPMFGDAVFTLSGPEPPSPPPPPIPPPGPIPPIPPPPVDDLGPRLKALYIADTSPAKRGQLVNLIGIYQAMAEHSANDKAITTSQELLDVLNSVKKGMLMEGVLVDFRRAIGVEVAAVVGQPNALPFDREKVSAMFRRIVKALPVPE